MTLPVIDRLLDLSFTPWSDRFMKEYMKAKADEKKFTDSLKATQVKNTIPSHPLKDYAGMYTNPIYGDMQIELENLFKRPVDLVEKEGLRNPSRRHEILSTAQIIYES